MTVKFVKSLLGDEIPNNKCSRMDILDWWKHLEAKSPIEKKKNVQSKPIEFLKETTYGEKHGNYVPFVNKNHLFALFIL